MIDKFMKENPHPVVEDHYYIRELIEKQEKRTADKKKWQEWKKNEVGFQEYCKDFKEIELLNFYCQKCETDFTARAKKQIDSWDNIAYYKIKHRCGTWSIRHITDRLTDQYFYKSKQVAKDREKGKVDMLQPFETGYNLAYGKNN